MNPTPAHSPLHPLRFAKFTLHLEATEDLFLPQYKGSTFRGGFGNALKKAVCMTKTFDCPPCLLQHNCPYISIFEPKVDKTTADLLRIGRDATQPFVLEPPLTEQRPFKKGEPLTAGLILIGKAMDMLPYFIHTFTVLGERIGLGMAKGKFVVRHVTDEDGATVYDGQTQMLKSSYRIVQFTDLTGNTPPPQELTLKFLTPTRIKSSYRQNSRHLIRMKNAENVLTLIESLYHRLFTLTNLYCRPDVQDYREHKLDLVSTKVHLVKSNDPWDDWERISNRQRKDGHPTKMKLGGFAGEATIGGELSDFVPLLKAGEFLHVGSGATFGLGKFVLTP
ncbi:MAG: CRISPR system precrRNA processing endoribonuclease RAMP protein Cas6 [Bacteroidetes bacterium]|nr:CRISPR system precrRNA processing endoribonuclease RAMP protein Cas6 [Bacteroidota bacterium]MCW5897533.1 CRISPR system precrRNA processing endoribonuclease RAMP protein Cas6 [Bacteroidota bacterium]